MAPTKTMTETTTVPVAVPLQTEDPCVGRIPPFSQTIRILAGLSMALCIVVVASILSVVVESKSVPALITVSSAVIFVFCLTIVCLPTRYQKQTAAAATEEDVESKENEIQDLYENASFKNVELRPLSSA